MKCKSTGLDCQLLSAWIKNLYKSGKPLHTKMRLALICFFCAGCSRCAIAMNHAGYGYSTLCCWQPSRSSFVPLEKQPPDVKKSGHRNGWCEHCDPTGIHPAWLAIKIRSVQYQIQINWQYGCVLNQTWAHGYAISPSLQNSVYFRLLFMLDSEDRQFLVRNNACQNKSYPSEIL